jgi:hypothetical protein
MRPEGSSTSRRKSSTVMDVRLREIESVMREIEDRAIPQS